MSGRVPNEHFGESLVKASEGKLSGETVGGGGRRRLVDVAVVSDYLDVKRNTVYRWAREGRMAGAYRLNGLWRFSLDEVADWASACRQRVQQPR